MRLEQRYKEFIRYFSENMPEVKTELEYENDYQLLVAVVLSAQCTDKRVNATTPLLFKHFPDINALSKASFESLSLIIKSISYPNNKSKNLISMAKILMETHKGLIPKSVEELVKLPGVGRKTANVLTSVLYNQPNMPVDTHVFRVSNRVGLTNNSKTPLETEKVLTK
ncbi:MAG: endonuclease III, partial [Bacteroidales bacterium]